MFGLKYELTCPYCGETHLADHGITPYYRINGGCDVEYIEEHCWECGKSYFRACYGYDVMNMKLKGLTYDEALFELERQDIEKNERSLGVFLKEITEQRLKEQEERRIEKCNDVYFTDNKKLYINKENINEEDLTCSSVTCW